MQMPEKNDLDFIVMPKLGPEAEKSPGRDLKRMAKSSGESGTGRRGKMIAAGILAVLVFGLAVYFTYNHFIRKQTEPPAQNNIVVPPAKQPPADSDNDGLTDADEQKLGTDQKKADTDGDGLADGDEVHVYGSDPLLPDTDGDTFKDGDEVAKGYSPVMNSKDKATVGQQQKWLKNAVEFGLHEPTITTLRSASTQTSPASSTPPSAIYSNKIYGYSIILPDGFRAREQDSGQEAGIYFSDSAPEGGVENDPIFISLAGRTANASQTLRGWAEASFAPAAYDSLVDLTINSEKAVELKDLKSDVCPQNKTFFLRNSNVLAITLSCTSTAGLGPYYNQILNSFKFN
jgi:hypothetical protein